MYPVPLNIMKTWTHCRLNELSHTIYWKILISILGMPGIHKKKTVELFAISEDPDQTVCSESALFASYPFRDLQTTMREI